jgi:hypothetical protein
MGKRKSFRSTVRMAFVAPVVGLFACNAILGTSDYKVGDGSDGGSDQPPGQGDGGAGNMDAGGSAGTGGKATGTGGASTGGAPGAGGRATGGAGGKGSGGKGSGGANPGTGGSGPGGAGGTGAVTADDFVGEWDTDAETATIDCGDGMPTTDVGSDIIFWDSGSSPGTIETIAVAGCLVVASVNGRVATITPAPPCVDQGISYAINGTFTILADGTARLDETVVATMAGTTCVQTGTGIFTKYLPP